MVRLTGISYQHGEQERSDQDALELNMWIDRLRDQNNKVSN